MTKPFERRELEVRINTLIRRYYGNFSNVIVIGQLVLDTHNHQVLGKGRPILLSAREYGVLEI